MPIYEFYCKENNTLYSFLVKSLAYQNSVPRCPEDPQFSMEKKVSGFAFIGKAKDPTDAIGMDDIHDAKMESVMAELERDMAGLSEDNPDPKQMADLMRKMSSLNGKNCRAKWRRWSAVWKPGRIQRSWKRNSATRWMIWEKIGWGRVEPVVS